jgi:lipid A disaccharide synthetase
MAEQFQVFKQTKSVSLPNIFANKFIASSNTITANARGSSLTNEFFDDKEKLQWLAITS